MNCLKKPSSLHKRSVANTVRSVERPPSTETGARVLVLDSWWLVVLRSIAVILVFTLLHWLYTRYFYNPLFRPDLKKDLIAQAAAKLCEPGDASCLQTVAQKLQTQH